MIEVRGKYDRQSKTVTFNVRCIIPNTMHGLLVTYKPYILLQSHYYNDRPAHVNGPLLLTVWDIPVGTGSGRSESTQILNLFPLYSDAVRFVKADK